MTDNRFDFHRSRNDPDWMVEITAEWVPQVPGQRYPGDTGPLRNGAGAIRRPTASGRAGVYQSGQRPAPPPGPFPPRLTGVDGHGAPPPRSGRPAADERRPPYPDGPFTDGRGRWTDEPGPRYDDGFAGPRAPRHEPDPRGRRHDPDRRHDHDPRHDGGPGPRDRRYDGPPDGPGRRDGFPDRRFADGRGGQRPEEHDRRVPDDAWRGPGDGRRPGSHSAGRGSDRGYDGRDGSHTDGRGRVPLDGRGGPLTDGRGRAPVDGWGPHHDRRDPGGRGPGAYPADGRIYGGYGPEPRHPDRRDVDHREFDRRDPDRREFDRRDFDHRGVDRRDLDRREPERHGPDRRDLDRHGSDRREPDGRRAPHADGRDGWQGPRHPDNRRDGWDGLHGDRRGRDSWDGRGATPRPPEPEPRHPRDRDPYATGPVSPPAGGPRLYGEPRPHRDGPPPADIPSRPDDRRPAEPDHRQVEPDHRRPTASGPPHTGPDGWDSDRHRQPGRPVRQPDRDLPYPFGREADEPERDHDPRRGPGRPAPVSGGAGPLDEPYGRVRPPLPEQPDAARDVPPTDAARRVPPTDA
ncbi:hypothetical protein AAFH96_35315, partial [Polymorphospora sp. 2-325]